MEDLRESKFFVHANKLLTEVEEKLKEFGPEKFMRSPEESAKKSREAFAEYFFILALKKDTGLDWWLSQPEDQFPDFELVSFQDDPIKIESARFELVTIPPHCKDFREMIRIVDNKVKKKYPPGFHLLVYVNHINSIEWINLLNIYLKQYYPFGTVWTVNLLFRNKAIFSATVKRIRPRLLNIDVIFSDAQIYIPQPVPSYMKEIQTENGIGLTFKEGFVKELRKSFREKRLN